MIINNLPEDYIDNKVQEICRSIWKEGSDTSHYDIFLSIYEYVKDNIYKYLPENPWDEGYDQVRGE